MFGTAQAIVIAAAVCGASAAAAQTNPAVGTALLSGRVTDARTELPLEGVRLILRDYGRRSDTKATTDSDGRYVFTKLAAGNYQVVAAHKGYITRQHGVAEPSILTVETAQGLIAVTPGGTAADINFQMIKGATIRGRVTNPEGQPIEGASVSSAMAVGPNQFATTSLLGIGGYDTSSKTGEFVLEGLAPGFYRVTAMPPPEKNTVRAPFTSEFQTTAYPGAPREQAVAIRVTGDETISGIGFPLIRTDLLTISGQVVRTDSAGPIDGYVVAGSLMRNVSVDNEGGFRAGGLEPGRYTVWVRAKTAGGFEAAWETVDALTDVAALQLAMSPTATIAGRVVTTDGAALPVEGFRVAAAWTADGKDIDPLARDQAEVGADGTFEIAGVFGDRTLRVIGLPAGWEIDRVAAGNRPTDPLRVAPGERVDLIVVIARTAIRGRVTTPEGQPLADARVTATLVGAPENGGDAGATSSVTTPRGTKATGEFALRGLADGLYFLEARVEQPRDSVSKLLRPGQPEFQPTYYPGGSREDAVAVRVTRGDVVSNVVIPLTRINLFSISGHVVRRDSSGRIDAHLLAPGNADQALPLDAENRFTLTGLKPGRHVLWARAATANGFEAAWALVDVATDHHDVPLTMMPTATITGRIVTSEGDWPALAGLRVAGAWTHRGVDVDVVWRDQADVDEAGRFQLDGMFGERSLQVIGLPDGWHVQQIVHDGRQASTLNVSSDAPAVTIVVAAR